MESGRRLDQEFADLLWDPPGGVILTRGLRSYRCFIFLRLNSIGDIGIRFIQICCNEQVHSCGSSSTYKSHPHFPADADQCSIFLEIILVGKWGLQDQRAAGQQ